MTREAHLDGGGEDAQLAALGVVHEHRLAQPQIGGHSLANGGRNLTTVEEDGQRVAARPILVAEHAQEMQSRHGRSG